MTQSNQSSQSIHLFGSTGSIGTQTLDVVAEFPNQFKITAISGFSNTELLAQQANRFRPAIIAVPSDTQKDDLLPQLNYTPDIMTGRDGLATMAKTPCDCSVIAISGAAALEPVSIAIEHCPKIALANKEVLVAAGGLIMAHAQSNNTAIIPIDSEHSGVFQCLSALNHTLAHVKSITLTASGGPFLHRDPATFSDITIEEALRHPNWSMGKKITIDSASLANKGLEIIEAHYLFGLDYNHLDVVIHPKSIVHALVTTIDGAILTHMGPPDMKLPIQYALTHPNRYATPFKQPHITELSDLEFNKPNTTTFPMLKMAFDAGQLGQSGALAYNAANERAVDQFLIGAIPFTDIHPMVSEAVDQFNGESIASIDDAIALDQRIKQTI